MLNSKKLEYQYVLLSLGQFESTVDEFLDWLESTNKQLETIIINSAATPPSEVPDDVVSDVHSDTFQRDNLDALAAKLRVFDDLYSFEFAFFPKHVPSMVFLTFLIVTL